MNFKNWLKENFDDEFVLPPGWDDNPKPFVYNPDPNDPWSVSRPEIPQKIPPKTPAKKSAEPELNLNIVTPYINPDDLYTTSSGSITFIYIVNEDKLFADKNKATHKMMIDNNDFLRKHYEKFLPFDIRKDATTVDLFGRIGRHRKLDSFQSNLVASFWGTNKQLFDQHLIPCLQKLIQERLINPTDLVSTPFYGTVYIQKVLNNSATSNNHMDNEKYELYRKLHLMRGDEKRKAMDVLGVGGGGKPHPMATAMQKHGLLKPGQKWWAPTSENAE